MEYSLETIKDLSVMEEENRKNKVIHTFYLNNHGALSIDKRMCELLELGSKYNLVLVKDEKNERYLLELRNPRD